MGARGEGTGRPVACARKSSRGATNHLLSSTEDTEIGRGLRFINHQSQISNRFALPLSVYLCVSVPLW